VVAKVEWHPGELYPRVGFIVTNLARPAERVVAFCNQRGTAEQWIKERKGAIKWTRLPCRTFAANAVRLQLHALACNLGNFMRTLVMPKTVEPWSLTSRREKLIKIGAKVVSHGRYVTFQMAEGRGAATDVQGYPDAHYPAAGTAGAGMSRLGLTPTTGGLHLEHEKAANSSAASYAIPGFGRQRGWLDRISLRRRVNETENHA
jgi:hypothetical protein